MLLDGGMLTSIPPVKEIDEANTIFDELMGDKVEPRRVFIEHNALSASVDV